MILPACPYVKCYLNTECEDCECTGPNAECEAVKTARSKITESDLKSNAVKTLEFEFKVQTAASNSQGLQHTQRDFHPRKPLSRFLVIRPVLALVVARQTLTLHRSWCNIFTLWDWIWQWLRKCLAPPGMGRDKP